MVRLPHEPAGERRRVLLTLDESTYLPRDWAMGADHPIAWEHEFDGGRAWYTQRAHAESYSEPLFLVTCSAGSSTRWRSGEGASSRTRRSPSVLTLDPPSTRDVDGPRRRLSVVAGMANAPSARRCLVVRSKTVTLRDREGHREGRERRAPARALARGSSSDRAEDDSGHGAGASATVRRLFASRRARRGTPAGRAAAAT